MNENRPIFISARVRSGSTMLWHIYHQLPGYRAFIQPCHDNLLQHIRNTRPMPSHRGVKDYWGEFRPLLDQLPRWHRPAFGLTRMLLEADEPWPELRDYIQFLIDQCDGETPVLQFNTACWRLPWLRRNFPEARIMHLWREPRDHWYSIVRHLPREQWDQPNLSDAYELLQWSADLAPHLPFLFDDETNTSYARVYYLWRLSRLAGDRLADTTLSYNEQLQHAPDQTLRKLVADGLLHERDIPTALHCIEPTKTGQWANHHPSAWFECIEQHCERKLDQLGLLENFGVKSLVQIRDEHPGAWNNLDHQASTCKALNTMLLAYSGIRSEHTCLLHDMRSLKGELNVSSMASEWFRQAIRRLRNGVRR